ncbi:LOW QUALITY PROTEIN: nitric oxide synthase, salivary gland-like [Homalodisca vitripennis]|nr:LOW QUALITY PROTEIN: nitric oxide synthase, salivary gland-like [Homalodisca vitripennis]
MAKPQIAEVDVNHPKKPLRLRNLTARTESYDALHHSQVYQAAVCSKEACLGSVVYQHIAKTTFTARPKDEVILHAKNFLDQYFASIKRANSQAHVARWGQVQEEIQATGHYQLTETELVYGAKLAWRNAARCIGRIQWSKLQVFDCRSVTTTSGMFEAICNHIKYSTNKGNIRSAITVFPQRTDGKHDYRVWNPQLLAYAGYKNADGTVTGDPINVEFTEVCTKLGWKGKGTRWDILPLVLSANGHDPDYFDIPPELVMEVPLVHPEYDWFGEMGLRWYAVPAVSNMMFDCGGLQFTAAPFNGWYMSTEIGARDLCDVNRYNLLETLATKMGLDTRTPVTLWKDKALIEANVAVLHSFQINNVTIVDHHTAAESFMKHYENEQRLRQGCPADWAWIVPPISGSITPVFHQEMAHYNIYPTYSYQDPAWKVHIWKKGKDGAKTGKKPRRKFHFKQIARAVKFTSKLFGSALSRRIKATILYATETGKSEQFAKKLSEMFSHAFHSQYCCMEDYDMSSIEHEALLLVVASTFGNGDPPENGQSFAQSLYTLKMEHTGGMTNGHSSPLNSASFIKANSQSDHLLERTGSLRESVTDTELFGPLSNVRFAVFALGSSAYPNFCAFGAYVDNLLGELGGERLMKLTTGDEMCGQQQTFVKWAPEVFRVACETFCLDDCNNVFDLANTLNNVPITASTVRLVDCPSIDLKEALSKYHNRKIYRCNVACNRNLHGSNSSIATLGVELDTEAGVKYEPGDHVGVLACNQTDLVDGIIAHLDLSEFDPDKPVELQHLKETQTSSGVVRTWEPHERLPRESLRVLLTRFLDITTPPTPQFLQFLASCTIDPEDKDHLILLATEPTAYEDWRHWRFPHLLEVLEEFPSVRPLPALLLAHLTPLQPRFYSISSSPALCPNQVHLTVGVVSYRTQDGEGPVHYGVCSNYLHGIKEGDQVYLFVRSAPNFHLPADESKPVIMVGPGTGIAPFRGFWQHRYAMKKKQGLKKAGKMTLFFGCRLRSLDLHKEDKEKMVAEGVLDKVFLALSREPGIPKTYVQDLMRGEAKSLYHQLVQEEGHFYVCGDVTMAEHVLQTLKVIVQAEGNMSADQVENYMLTLRDENRYHEDIFGITLRTTEVHNKSRETARIRMASQSNP